MLENNIVRPLRNVIHKINLVLLKVKEQCDCVCVLVCAHVPVPVHLLSLDYLLLPNHSWSSLWLGLFLYIFFWRSKVCQRLSLPQEFQGNSSLYQIKWWLLYSIAPVLYLFSLCSQAKDIVILNVYVISRARFKHCLIHWVW